MKTSHRAHSLGLLTAVLVGCAGSASPDDRREENVATARQADGAEYVQTFDADFQAILFQPASAAAPIDWVIVHVTIDGDRTTNVRMPQTGTSAAAGPTYEIESLPVLPGDTLAYSFTYSIDGLARDTPVFTQSLPADWVPKRLSTRATDRSIELVSAAPIAWADVHYSVDGGPTQNVRMSASGTSQVQAVSLEPGSVLRYSITYSTGVAVFDTAVASFTAGGGGGARFVVDLGADSGARACVANGDSGGRCNLRAALLAGASVPGPVTIDLAVDSTIDEGSIAVASGAGGITIESRPDGEARTILGTGSSRLFEIASGATLAIARVAITGFGAMDSGAAIVNRGALDLDGATIADNTTHCFGVGAMDASATCTGGAIDNAGNLTLGGGTTFSRNIVSADASTAMYTTASAQGGAIVSSGTIAIVGPVTFTGNTASASAYSGAHPAPIGGAIASASGGAIANGGTLTVTAPAGSCRFTGNRATAAGSSPQGATTLSSAGGAIANTGSLSLPDGVCVFSDNAAQTGNDVDG